MHKLPSAHRPENGVSDMLTPYNLSDIFRLLCNDRHELRRTASIPYNHHPFPRQIDIMSPFCGMKHLPFKALHTYPVSQDILGDVETLNLEPSRTSKQSHSRNQNLTSPFEFLARHDVSQRDGP
jgi:hypothetical protein